MQTCERSAAVVQTLRRRDQLGGNTSHYAIPMEDLQRSFCMISSAVVMKEHGIWIINAPE